MNDQRQKMDSGFTQEVLADCHHLCLIYDSEEQRRRTVSEYLAAGIRQGELVRYFADTTSPKEIRSWLLATCAGLPIEHEGSFQFQLRLSNPQPLRLYLIILLQVVSIYLHGFFPVLLSPW